MDATMTRIWAYFWLPETKYVIVVFVVLALLLLRLLPRDRRRIGTTSALFAPVSYTHLDVYKRQDYWREAE